MYSFKECPCEIDPPRINCATNYKHLYIFAININKLNYWECILNPCIYHFKSFYFKYQYFVLKTNYKLLFLHLQSFDSHFFIIPVINFYVLKSSNSFTVVLQIISLDRYQINLLLRLINFL